MKKDLPKPSYALRLGLRQVDGLSRADAERLLAARARRPFADVEDLRARAGLTVAAIQRLAAADAFRSVGLDRRQALWDCRTLRSAPDLPLFAHADARAEGAEAEPVRLPATALSEHVVADYQTLRLSLKAHPLHFLRSRLAAEGYVRAEDLRARGDGRPVRVAGLVLIRQKPGTAKGVCFITVEDESGTANLVIWPDVMQRFHREVMGARLMAVEGVVQLDEAVVHVVARRIIDRTALLGELSADLLPAAVARGDHVARPLPRDAGRHPREAQVIPKSRDFH